MSRPGPFLPDRPVPRAALVATVLLAAAAALAAPPHLPQSVRLLEGDGSVLPAAGDQTSAKVFAGGGGFLAVWTDNRSTVLDDGDAGTGEDVYAARLAADGSLIDTTPFAVARAPGDQYDPLAVWNGADWLVIWTGTVPSSPVNRHNTEGARVSAAGELLDTAPFEIWEYGNSDEHIVGAASDGQGWCVVTTDVYFDGLGTKTRLIAIGITADGVVQSTHNIYSPSCCSFFGEGAMAYAQGTYMLVFHGYVDSWDYGIFGLRMNDSLTTLDSYPQPLVRTSWADDLYYYNPTITTDGGLFYVAWEMWHQDVSSQIFGARIQPDDTSLDGDGDPISDVLPPDLHLKPGVAWDGTQWVVGWPQEGQTRLARVSAAGSVLDPGGQTPGLPEDLSFAGNGNGLQLAWSEANGSGAQPYDAVGAVTSTVLSVGTTSTLSLGAPSQTDADIAYGDAGGLVVFASRTADGTRVLAAALDASGAPAPGEPTELASGSVGHPCVAWDGQDYLAAWEDGASIRAARLDASGVVLDPSPSVLMTGSRPDAAGRVDGFFVAAAGAGGTHAVRVDGDGTLLDPTPITLDAGAADHAATAVYTGLWLAAWETGSADGGDVAASLVADGPAVIGPLAVTTAGDGIAARRPSVAAGDTVLFVWQDDRGADLDLYGRRMASGIQFTDPAGGVALITAAGDQTDPAVDWDGVRFVYDFADARGRVNSLDDRKDVYRGWAFGVGPLAVPDGLELFAGDATAGDPAVAGADDRQFYAASVFHPEAPYASYRVEVRFAGLPTAAGDPPLATRLLAPYPNPANPRTSIRFVMGRAGDAVVDVYDLRGARVRTLRAAGLDAGPHELAWNGLDAAGRQAPSGTYLFRLRAGGVDEAGKVSLVR